MLMDVIASAIPNMNKKNLQPQADKTCSKEIFTGKFVHELLPGSLPNVLQLTITERAIRVFYEIF